MASQNTVSRDKLTEPDKKVLETCGGIIKIILERISNPARKSEFLKDYGSISFSRDAGQGRGAGKLQRDALTTRGRQAKAPFSNRNLRWHPLVLSSIPDPRFLSVEEVEATPSKLLRFKISGKWYLPKQVYALEKTAVISGDKWAPLITTLRNWTQEDWIKNWCAIPVVEYCMPQQAIGSFAVLGVSVAANFYSVDPADVYKEISKYLSCQRPAIILPVYSKDILNCPLCKSPVNEYPAGLKPRIRPEIWKPSWQSNKRTEGEDESIQLTHAFPLQEGATYHTPEYTRYGHRWCNVAMTDHSIPETLSFFIAVAKKNLKN